MKNLSKSRFVSGLQCEKKLFFDVFRTDLKPAVTEQQQALFDTGHTLGRLAQQVFPGGADATEGIEGNWSEAINRTRDWLESGKHTIYEAAFSIPGGFAALDILHHNEGERWAIEVKSSTGVKAYHISDASFQYHVMEKAGFRPDKVFLMHVNNKYVKRGPISPANYFHLEDITGEVLKNQKMVEDNHAALLNMLQQGREPVQAIGQHCLEPFTCDYMPHCWAHVPENSVFTLHDARGKDWTLYNRGIVNLSDVPEDFTLNHRQSLQVRGAKLNQKHIDKEKIKEFLSPLKGPLYFFDFETINAAVPILDGSSPFEQVPFQYSLHVTDLSGNIIEHKAFLANEAHFGEVGAPDPRLSLIEQLKKDIGPEGSILAYNSAFERMVLEKLAATFQPNRLFLQSLADRLVDLLIPFKKAWYYLPEMGGSASIKSVLPAIAPEFSYADLPINNGGVASQTFHFMINGGYREQAEEKRKELLRYCERDSEGMVVIFRQLKKLVSA